MPPDIIAATFDSGETIVIGPTGQAVFVIARDPDGDPIQFTWTLSRDGIQGSGTPVAYEDGGGSQFRLTSDPGLNDQQLRCYVDDGKSELVTLSWPLEVL